MRGHRRTPGLSPAGLLWAPALLLLFTAVSAGAQSELTEAETRGKRLYTTGEAADGREIVAVLGAGGTEVPAAALPCVGCHGRRGEGNPEGGLLPSNVQWETLARSYGGVGAAGRSHPPYSEATFKRAVGMGIDSGGKPLHAAMPHYRLTHEESADLVAYLKKISSELDPGVTARTLRLGVILPPPAQAEADGALDRLADDLRAVLEARFELLNRQGGLYGRQIELAFTRPREEGWRRRAEVESFIEEEQVFALLAAYMAGAEAELAALASAEGLPSVGPFSLHPQIDQPLNPWVFYLLPGLEQQARALVQYSANVDARPTPTRLVVLYSQAESLAGVHRAIEGQVATLGRKSWTEVDWRPFSAEAPIDLLAMADTPSSDDLLFLGTQRQTTALLHALASSHWRPRLFLLGPLAGAAPLQAAPTLTDRLFVSQPTVPADLSPGALDLYRQLRGAAGASTSFAIELSALAAAEALIEGLSRAGKAISRQSLAEALETVYEFHTGFAPPLTFTANRRVGALGAYIARPDQDSGSYLVLGSWVTPE